MFVILLATVKILSMFLHFKRKIKIILSVVNNLHTSQIQSKPEPSQTIESSSTALTPSITPSITTGKRKRVPNTKYNSKKKISSTYKFINSRKNVLQLILFKSFLLFL